MSQWHKLPCSHFLTPRIVFKKFINNFFLNNNFLNCSDNNHVLHLNKNKINNKKYIFIKCFKSYSWEDSLLIFNF